MVSKIRFSIIIPTYNREIYLLDAVRSAVNASPANAEIIIVNDGDDFSETTKNVWIL
jgi:glycosyltransferase involved in cell wall biosynthesis